ncbi:MAG: hypothetical protein J5685_02120 [Clostridiales bacterium]|nr:hypothetical protein [Clostridiales bacterium]
MHVLIINGSPRVQKYSNTDKIISALKEGMEQYDPGITTELYSISDRKQWDDAREAFVRNDEILIALPLFVECIPGLLLEFLSTLPPKDGHTRMSFVLQSGFAEASQLRCGEKYLKTLPGRLGCIYKGTLIKGDNFSIRLVPDDMKKKITAPYVQMGKVYAEHKGFDCEEARKFAGPEYFNAPMRLILRSIFATFGRIMFRKTARSWGCDKPLNYRPYPASR